MPSTIAVVSIGFLAGMPADSSVLPARIGNKCRKPRAAQPRIGALYRNCIDSSSIRRVAFLLRPGMRLVSSHPPRRLMVVDDDHDLADSMCAWIGLATDWTAVPAYGAEQAVAKAREEPFDAVLLDIAMPGTDGFDTAGRLDRANEASHPAILAVTGNADLRDAASVDTRFVASLLKPADSDRLLGLLADLDARN